MDDKVKFDYHYRQEAERYTFYRIPKLLFSSDKFSSLSCEAKVLYGLLLDRMSVSRKNNWTDEQNRVYIIFTIEEIQEVLVCQVQKACKLMKQLETCGLVEKKRLGLGKANILYVKNFTTSQSQDCDNHSPEDEPEPDKDDKPEDLPGIPVNVNPLDIGTEDFLPYTHGVQPAQNFEIHNPATMNSEVLELRKSLCSNTDFSYLNPSYNNPFLSFQEDGTEVNGTESYADIQKYVKRQIEYDILSSRDEIDKDRLRELMHIMVEVLASNSRYLFVDGDMRPIEQVKSQYRLIDSQVIQHVLQCLDENTTEVRKVKNYLRTCLYNAPITMATQIRMQVNHDMSL